MSDAALSIPLKQRLAARGFDSLTLLVVPAVLFLLLLFIYPFLYGLFLSFNPMIAVPALMMLARQDLARERRIARALVIFLAPAFALGLIPWRAGTRRKGAEQPQHLDHAAPAADGAGADPALVPLRLVRRAALIFRFLDRR